MAIYAKLNFQLLTPTLFTVSSKVAVNSVRKLGEHQENKLVYRVPIDELGVCSQQIGLYF